MKSYTIYALADNLGIRYVGATTKPSARLNQHLSSAGKKNAKVSQWLAQLKENGQKPVFSTLEICSMDWENREKHWIEIHRVFGILLNQTDGGLGTPGLKLSEGHKASIGEAAKRAHTEVKETDSAKRNMSEGQLRYVAELAARGLKKTHKPLSAEGRARMSAAMQGKKASPDARAKMSAARKDPPQWLRDKWAKAAKNRDPDWVAWFAKQQTGKPKSEETKQKMSAAAKARWAKKKSCARE